MKLYKLLLLAVLFLATVSTALAETYPKEYQVEVMQAINQFRKEKGLEEFVVDPKICELAEIISVDSEKAYPNKITNSWLSNNKYGDYLEGHNNVESNSWTPLDMLVEFSKKAKGTDLEKEVSLVPSTEDLIENYTQESDFITIPTSDKLTHACVGRSDGIQGYKPFAYLIGASGKSVEKSWFQMIWNPIANLFSGWF